jgi:hypothetical protein
VPVKYRGENDDGTREGAVYTCLRIPAGAICHAITLLLWNLRMENDVICQDRLGTDAKHMFVHVVPAEKVTRSAPRNPATTADNNSAAGAAPVAQGQVLEQPDGYQFHEHWGWQPGQFWMLIPIIGFVGNYGWNHSVPSRMWEVRRNQSGRRPISFQGFLLCLAVLSLSWQNRPFFHSFWSSVNLKTKRLVPCRSWTGCAIQSPAGCSRRGLSIREFAP